MRMPEDEDVRTTARMGTHISPHMAMHMSLHVSIIATRKSAHACGESNCSSLKAVQNQEAHLGIGQEHRPTAAGYRPQGIGERGMGNGYRV